MISIQRSDTTVQLAVQRELARDARLSGCAVGVAVDGGVVTLSGLVTSHEQRQAAQDAAHAAGVLDVANELRVQGQERAGRCDTELAHAVRRVLAGVPKLCDHRVRSTVTHGWVLLEGTVASSAQQREICQGVRNVVGVCGVNDELTVESEQASA